MQQQNAVSVSVSGFSVSVFGRLELHFHRWYCFFRDIKLKNSVFRGTEPVNELLDHITKMMWENVEEEDKNVFPEGFSDNLGDTETHE